MRISGVLALFPLTIVTTFFVLQQQTTLERPFERHAGAYTDIGHIVSSIKNAHQREVKRISIPATMPIRKEIQRIGTKSGDITLAVSEKQKPTKQIASAASKDEKILEQIWQDHVSNNQAAPANKLAATGVSGGGFKPTTLENTMASTSGLISPKDKTDIFSAPTNRDSSEGFNGNAENAARLDVMVLGATIGGETKEIAGVDFVGLADDNNIIPGDRGRFTFEYMLAQPRQTLSGVFRAKGYVPTRVDLPLEIGSYGSLIPLMSIEGMDKYLNSQNIRAPGGFIVVDLDQQIIDVELDRPYQHKAYFSADMKPTEADDSARFVLFAGVAPGNVMLRYLASSRHIVERVGLVVADEILYDLPIVEQEQSHSFGLFEMESLSLTPRELTLSSRNIRAFNKKETAIQDSLNYYTLKFSPSIVGTRKYTEIDHLGTTFYVGHTGADKLVIPGQGFLNEVLAFHRMDRLERECMVQFNLPSDREVLEVYASGEGSLGPMALDESYLNRDGTVSIEATEFSTHGFLLGDMQGQIHIRLDYVDGSVDFISSYCAPGTYLVEQL